MLYSCFLYTCNLAISFAVLQVIGFVFIPFASIDSNLSLSVSAGVHVCACIGALCTCYVSATLFSIAGMYYVYIYRVVCWCIAVPCLTACAVSYVPLQGLGYFLNLFSLSIPIPWCVSQTLPAHIVALLGYIPPLLILGTVIVYIIW